MLAMVLTRLFFIVRYAGLFHYVGPLRMEKNIISDKRWRDVLGAMSTFCLCVCCSETLRKAYRILSSCVTSDKEQAREVISEADEEKGKSREIIFDCM
jgi:hypothetical protein